VQQSHPCKNAQVVIQNTTFSSKIIEKQSLILIINATLILHGPIKFNRNIGEIYFEKKGHDYKTILELNNSSISAHGYIEFSENYVGSIIYHICKRQLDCYFLSILGSTVINITSNAITTYFIAEFPQSSSEIIGYPICYFQYFTIKDYKYHIAENNTSIILHNNKYKSSTIESGIKDALLPARKTLIPTDSQLHIMHSLLLVTSVTIKWNRSY